MSCKFQNNSKTKRGFEIEHSFEVKQRTAARFNEVAAAFKRRSRLKHQVHAQHDLIAQSKQCKRLTASSARASDRFSVAFELALAVVARKGGRGQKFTQSEHSPKLCCGSPL